MMHQPYCPIRPKKKGDLTVARVGSIDGSPDTASALLRRQVTSLCVTLFRLSLSSRRIDFPFLIQCMGRQRIVKKRVDVDALTPSVCENFPKKLLRGGIGQTF
jgi:hypothetical protein